jgi:quercetin dioxygenase-like cupin family protein
MLIGKVYSTQLLVGVMSFYKINMEMKKDAPVKEEGSQGVRIKWLLDKSVGTPTFAMRHFTVEPRGHTPRHKHEWEHEVYVLEGEGFVRHEDREYPLRPGDAVFVPPNQVHQFRSTQSAYLRFLCLIPV